MSPSENQFQVSWSNQGTLVVISDNVRHEYAKGPGNQLIHNARMNPWESFLAMLEKKTDPAQWHKLQEHLATLDKTAAWKVKETFARLTTHED